MTLVQAMGIGTAGFTAMQAVVALERHAIRPGSREIIVTGAAGGLGSVAVAILAKLGYKVAAATGRPRLGDYLRALGAATIIDRAELTAPAVRPLDAERWGGGIDSVGGEVLASVLRATAVHGAVAACGLAGGAQFNATVYPFILRGVSLLGIDSVRVPKAERLHIWERLERDLPLDRLEAMIQIEPMTRIFELGELMLAGQLRGRTVIDVGK
jgi:acrylyl-CoA reductase (NADPH)